jgi:hypothetical protein
MSAYGLEGSVVIVGSFGDADASFGGPPAAPAEAGRNAWPQRTTVAHYDHNGFLRLSYDNPEASPRELELTYLEAIAQADLLLVANHRHLGCMGLTATAEFAWAAMLGVPRFVTYSPLSKGVRYPERQFVGDYTDEERTALQAIGYGYMDLHELLPEFRRSRKLGAFRPKEYREKADPMHQDDPQFATLRGICRRVLESMDNLPRPSKLPA